MSIGTGTIMFEIFFDHATKMFVCRISKTVQTVMLCRCPAGVGKWAAHYIQPAIPLTRPEETSFSSPYLGQSL